MAGTDDVVTNLLAGVQNMGLVAQNMSSIVVSAGTAVTQLTTIGTATVALGTALGTLNTAIGTLTIVTLGASLGGTASPSMTIASAVSTTSALVVSANSTRVNIMFHSSSASAVDMWVTPSTITAVVGRGLLLRGGSTVMIPSTCGWNAITTTGTTVLTVLEFF